MTRTYEKLIYYFENVHSVTILYGIIAANFLLIFLTSRFKTLNNKLSVLRIEYKQSTVGQLRENSVQCCSSISKKYITIVVKRFFNN